jgi:hypothetical protein
LVPDPWTALASWRVPYYVALASAAYEHNLIPVNGTFLLSLSPPR